MYKMYVKIFQLKLELSKKWKVS